MSMGNNDNPINSGEHVRDKLSDYMDNALPVDERERVRTHLEECADCRADYIELRATQKMVQNMPIMAAPRAFTLTPEMAGQARKASFWERFFMPRNAPRLATGSVLAFVLLVLVVLNSNGTNGFGPAASTGAPAPNASTGAAESQANTALKQIGTNVTPTTSAAGGSGFVSGGAPAAAAAPTTPEQAAPSPTDHTVPGANPPESGPSTMSAQDTPGVADTGTQPNPIIPPASSVGASGNSSPTTTTVDNAAVPPNVASTTSGVDSQAIPAPVASTGTTNLGLVALQLSLLALGLALAAAAFIAWRRA